MTELDRKAEAAAMAEALAPLTTDRSRIIVSNARRISATRWKHAANWVLVSEVFGLGSTYSWHLCRALGIDPEAQR